MKMSKSAFAQMGKEEGRGGMSFIGLELQRHPIRVEFESGIEILRRGRKWIVTSTTYFREPLAEAH